MTLLRGISQESLSFYKIFISSLSFLYFLRLLFPKSVIGKDQLLLFFLARCSTRRCQ